MTSVTFGHQSNWSPGIGIQEHLGRTKISRVSYSYSEYCCPFLPSRDATITHHGNHVAYCRRQSGRHVRPVLAGSVDGAMDPDESDRGINDNESPKPENGGMNFEMLRENLERSVGTDDSRFSGIDLATLIRNKYGKSYDVQLIKKEFMGRNLLALNVMWKYREQGCQWFGSGFQKQNPMFPGFELATSCIKFLYFQPEAMTGFNSNQQAVSVSSSSFFQKSFPLSEEEYLLRLDGVANTLKCWGAVAHIRNSLDKTKDRPRIGKAVSIFIDMDESGGRANEWIYK
ncbi:uncharacterized protein LOC120082114 isoform X1 [Benincasa hispida]|uniref:uncharacterized protein LOC120082114 isoform X1 n=1 Tax=Benincasa hispida TaxID=102211 RepID=UPI0019025047|nr:uncharacterized protein LOC120082114 isoform X1 [Benincasa hispida]